MNLKPIDHTALRTNQGFIILFSLLAFLFNQPWIIALVALVMLTGSLLLKRPGFAFLYTRMLKPAGILRPDVIEDNPEPHLFAQAFGGTVLAGAALALFLGASALGWGLAWIVIALAALNLMAGFCVGCAMYYWLNRLKIPGFIKSPPPGVFPGLRPKRGVQ